MGGLRGSLPSVVLNTTWLLHIIPLPQSSPQKAVGPLLGALPAPRCKSSGQLGGGREENSICMQALMKSWEPQLRVTGHQGRRGDGTVSGMLGVGAAATWGLVPFSSSLPFNPNPQTSVGSQQLPCVETFSYRRAPLHGYQSVGVEWVHKALRVCPPLPWSEVGFTHTNDLVPPKTCCLESWPDSILTCIFFQL